MRRLVLWSAAGLGLVCSCADLGSEKPEYGDPGNEGGVWGDEPDCGDDKTESPWDLDEGIPEDFVTPRDLIDRASGQRRGVLRWHGSDVAVEVQPSSGETEVTIELRYAGGEVVLPIDLELDLATTDGAFAETFDVKGEAWNEGLWVSTFLEEAELQGTFSATLTAPDADARILLEADSRAGHTTGRISVQGSTDEPPIHEIAFWSATPVDG